jgi:hypothetical protein
MLREMTNWADEASDWSDLPVTDWGEPIDWSDGLPADWREWDATDLEPWTGGGPWTFDNEQRETEP